MYKLHSVAFGATLDSCFGVKEMAVWLMVPGQGRFCNLGNFRLNEPRRDGLLLN